MTTLPILPTPTARLDETRMSGWLGQAEPGDVLDYHRGFFAVDTNATTSRLPDAERRALWAAEYGLVHLVQLRSGESDFRYRMIARPRPRTAIPSLATLLADAA